MVVLGSLFPDLCQMRTYYSSPKRCTNFPSATQIMFTRKCHLVQSICAGSNAPALERSSACKRSCTGALTSAIPLTAARKQMRWMAPAHGIWVPKCEGHQAFTSKMGAIRYADYKDRPRLGQARFSGPRH